MRVARRSYHPSAGFVFVLRGLRSRLTSVEDLELEAPGSPDAFQRGASGSGVLLEAAAPCAAGHVVGPWIMRTSSGLLPACLLLASAAVCPSCSCSGSDSASVSN